MVSFSNEGWNKVIRHNHSIRWLIGDIETENSLLKGILHPVSRVIMISIVIMVIHLLANMASGTLHPIARQVFKVDPNLRPDSDSDIISDELRVSDRFM